MYVVPIQAKRLCSISGGVTDASLLGAGLIPAYFAKTGELWRSCASCALMRIAAVLATDLERSESYTMTDKPCNDRVIERHPCLEVTLKTQ